MSADVLLRLELDRAIAVQIKVSLQFYRDSVKENAKRFPGTGAAELAEAEQNYLAFAAALEAAAIELGRSASKRRRRANSR
jgi:hypothetical protein